MQALDYYQKSLRIYQESDNKYAIASSLGNIGVVYSLQGNFAKALDYYQKGLAMSEAEDDKEGVAIIWAISGYSTVSKAIMRRLWIIIGRAWR